MPTTLAFGARTIMSQTMHFSAGERESLDRRRNGSLAWFLGSFLFWSCSTMLLVLASFTFLLGTGEQFVPLLLIIFGILPMPVWGFFLVRYFWIQRTIRRDRDLAASLDDEMVRHAWMRAASYGFWSMLGTLVLLTLYVMVFRILIATGVMRPVPNFLDAVQAPLSITVGIAVTIGSYLYQRRG